VFRLFSAAKWNAVNIMDAPLDPLSIRYDHTARGGLRRRREWFVPNPAFGRRVHTGVRQPRRARGVSPDQHAVRVETKEVEKSARGK
jgi:hypothetical protein